MKSKTAEKDGLLYWSLLFGGVFGLLLHHQLGCQHFPVQHLAFCSRSPLDFSFPPLCILAGSRWRLWPLSPCHPRGGPHELPARSSGLACFLLLKVFGKGSREWELFVSWFLFVSQNITKSIVIGGYTWLYFFEFLKNAKNIRCTI